MRRPTPSELTTSRLDDERIGVKYIKESESPSTAPNLKSMMEMHWMDYRLHNIADLPRYRFTVESNQVHTFLRWMRAPFTFCFDVTFV